MGTVVTGPVIGTIVTGLAIGTVVTGRVIIGSELAFASYSLFPNIEGTTPKRHARKPNTQQNNNTIKNHAHHGQPPPSVVVCVVVVHPPVVDTDPLPKPAILVNAKEIASSAVENDEQVPSIVPDRDPTVHVDS